MAPSFTAFTLSTTLTLVRRLLSVHRAIVSGKALVILFGTVSEVVVSMKNFFNCR